MKAVKELIDTLVGDWNYRKLPDALSESCREFYTESIPSYLKMEGDSTALYSLDGTKFANGYERIVVGDYGAFIEIAKSDMINDVLKVSPGQEYRLSSPYIDNVKYIWLTPKDKSNAKIYKQLRTVSYADYKADMFYVCPYEVTLEGR
jgi:hypothetical protein